MSRIINTITTTNIKLLIFFVEECCIDQSHKTVKIIVTKENMKPIRKIGAYVFNKFQHNINKTTN